MREKGSMPVTSPRRVVATFNHSPPISSYPWTAPVTTMTMKSAG